jgi:hypothetical protein
MTELVIQHFSTKNDNDLKFDGNNYFVKEKFALNKKNENYIEINNEEINSLHHINYYTFRKFFELLVNIKNPIIIETGSNAWGVDSSSLFDNFISKYGGTFYTVDINEKIYNNVKNILKNNNSKAFLDDSVNFLKKFNQISDKKIDAVYLDSYDLDWTNYEDSAIHGKNEFVNLIPHLNNYSIVMIDDTPINPEFLPFRNNIYESVKANYEKNNIIPGKGMYVEEVLKQQNILYKKILHHYGVIYEIFKN